MINDEVMQWCCKNLVNQFVLIKELYVEKFLFLINVIFLSTLGNGLLQWVI